MDADIRALKQSVDKLVREADQLVRVLQALNINITEIARSVKKFEEVLDGGASGEHSGT